MERHDWALLGILMSDRLLEFSCGDLQKLVGVSLSDTGASGFLSNNYGIFDKLS
jgi:hypothetical protein